MNNNNNSTLYFFEFIAMVMVVNIHYSLDVGILNSAIYKLCRTAVPFFFLISGYFGYNKDNKLERSRYKSKIISSSFIIAIYSFVYICTNIYIHFLDKNMGGFLNSISKPINYFYLIILSWCTPFLGVGHVWFYLSLLIIYVLFYYISRSIQNNIKLSSPPCARIDVSEA